jgi:hypothetical protein
VDRAETQEREPFIAGVLGSVQQRLSQVHGPLACTMLPRAVPRWSLMVWLGRQEVGLTTVNLEKFKRPEIAGIFGQHGIIGGKSGVPDEQ